MAGLFDLSGCAAVAIGGIAAVWLLSDGQPTARPAGVNAVVAADGGGDYRTVQAAIDAAPQHTSAAVPWVILVRPGTYREVVYVQREKRFVALVGEDPARTVITYDLHASTAGPDGKPIGTFRTPTVTIDADDFTAENRFRTTRVRSGKRWPSGWTAIVLCSGIAGFSAGRTRSY